MKHKTREWTTALMGALDQGVMDPRAVADMCMSYMSEFQVMDMCQVNDLMFLVPDEDDEDSNDD
jgi:hypothetical protein